MNLFRKKKVAIKRGPVEKCYVCARVSSKVVLQLAHKAFEDSKVARAIGLEAAQIIHDTYISNKYPRLFCGKTPVSIISGLFWLLIIKYALKINQYDFAMKLGTTAVTLRKSYQGWLKVSFN